MDPIRVLLQASIQYTADDWHVGRFSSLAETLRGLRSVEGEALVELVARNREPDASGRDPTLTGLDTRTFDELWLLGVDGGEALDDVECAAIDAFQRAGGGVLATRDHQDMGRWLRKLRGVGGAHFFHDHSFREPDETRWARDDAETRTIDFPNYHSGANGDFQRLEPLDAGHPLLRAEGGGAIEFFPSHPHEGAVAAPSGDGRARIVARGRSQVTGRPFNLMVAFERGDGFEGRGLAESSFHHFADYNWNPAVGAPSFVTEPPGTGIRDNPRVLRDIQAYVRNAVNWLAPAGRTPG